MKLHSAVCLAILSLSSVILAQEAKPVPAFENVDIHARAPYTQMIGGTTKSGLGVGDRVGAQCSNFSERECLGVFFWSSIPTRDLCLFTPPSPPNKPTSGTSRAA